MDELFLFCMIWSIACYIFFYVIFASERKDRSKLSIGDYLIFLFAPITLPILILWAIISTIFD